MNQNSPIIDQDPSTDDDSMKELLAMMVGDPAFSVAVTADVLTASTEVASANPRFFWWLAHELDPDVRQFVCTLADAAYRLGEYQRVMPFLVWIGNSPAAPESLASKLIHLADAGWLGLTPPETLQEYQETLTALLEDGNGAGGIVPQDLDVLTEIWPIYLAAGASVVGDSGTTSTWEYTIQTRWDDGHTEQVDLHPRQAGSRLAAEREAKMITRPGRTAVVQRRMVTYGPWVVSPNP